MPLPVSSMLMNEQHVIDPSTWRVRGINLLKIVWLQSALWIQIPSPGEWTLEQSEFKLHESIAIEVIDKNLCVSGAILFKLVLFKGQLHIIQGSFNRYTHKTKLCITDPLSKMLWPEARRNLLLYLPSAMVQNSLILCLWWLYTTELPQTVTISCTCNCVYVHRTTL